MEFVRGLGGGEHHLPPQGQDQTSAEKVRFTALLSTPDHLAVSRGTQVTTLEELDPQRHGKPQGLWERLSDCGLRKKVTDHKAVRAQLEVPVLNERSP